MPNEAEQKIKDLIQTKEAKIGVSWKLDGEQNVHQVNPGKYLLMSVFKLHLGMAFLDLVDRGKFSLDQKITLAKEDFPFERFSPLREKYGKNGGEVPFSEILVDTISASDNNGCDILLRHVGGPEKLNQYVTGLGVKDTSFGASEKDMHTSIEFLLSNSASPASVVNVLVLLDQGKVLSQKSRQFLLDCMINGKTGHNRIKGLLPKQTIVAHKTGSGPRLNNILTACNDAGIIHLPDGKRLYLAVFVADTKYSDEACEQIIANISKILWDCYSAK